MMTDYCQLHLTCANKTEAEKICNTLLVKHLIACAKQIPIRSTFSWQDKIESEDEVLLIMDSRMNLFEQIEEEVAKIHSYEIFVLQAVPVNSVSKKSDAWLDKELSR